MNSVIVLILGFVVAFLGYRVYAKYIDTKIIKSDPQRATPAKMYMDGVEFMPTNRNVLFGYQFKSIAGAAPIIGPIIAIQWGWLPALVWILGGALFIGWVQDYSSMMVAMRNDGASFGGLSHKLISPRARVILLAFIYFYLLLIAGAFGNVVVSTAVGLKAAPMAWLFLTIGGILAGQMIYKWRKDIILTTVVTVLIAHHPSLRQGPRGVHSRQPARLGSRRFRLLLLRRGPSDLAFCAADQLCGLLHRVPRALLRNRRDLRPPSRLHAARLYQFLDPDRAALADLVRDHRLRFDLRLAQHRLQLGNGPAARE
jgi:hypothetical protein